MAFNKAPFSTIVTKYPGTCKRCGGKVPVGTKVRFGKGKVYHFADECGPVARVAQHDPAVALATLAEREHHDHGRSLLDIASELERYAAETGGY